MGCGAESTWDPPRRGAGLVLQGPTGRRDRVVFNPLPGTLRAAFWDVLSGNAEPWGAVVGSCRIDVADFPQNSLFCLS